MKLLLYIRLPVLAFSLAQFALVATAQDGPPQFVIVAVNAVEAMLKSDGDAAIETFIDKAMVPSKDRDRAVLIERLRAIRREVRGLWDDVAVEAEPDGARLILSAGATEKQIKVVLAQEGISDLSLLEAAKPITLTLDNLIKTFDQLEAEGTSGVVYVRHDGEVVIKRAFGMANEELAIPNNTTRRSAGRR